MVTIQRPMRKPSRLLAASGWYRPAAIRIVAVGICSTRALRVLGRAIAALDDRLGAALRSGRPAPRPRYRLGQANVALFRPGPSCLPPTCTCHPCGTEPLFSVQADGNSPLRTLHRDTNELPLTANSWPLLSLKTGGAAVCGAVPGRLALRLQRLCARAGSAEDGAAAASYRTPRPAQACPLGDSHERSAADEAPCRRATLGRRTGRPRCAARCSCSGGAGPS